MDFKTNKPIYQQIVDFCFSKILTREWRAEERVVSVRELSTQLAVNSRTVLKAYEYLQTEDICLAFLFRLVINLLSAGLPTWLAARHTIVDSLNDK